MADRQLVIQGLIDLHIAGKGGPEAVASMKQILEQTKQIEKELGGLGTKGAASVGKLEGAFLSLGKTIAGYFAAGVVANFLRDSYIGFARTERQALAVENQIKALGQAAEGSGFRSFISDLSDASGIVDDELVPAFQRALATFKNYAAAQEVLSIASKFAAASINDVATNVDALNRFFLTGSARSLTAFNINVKAGEESVLNLNEGLKLVYDQLKITGDGFDDAQKDINSWRNSIDQARDSLGKTTATAVNFLQALGTKIGGSFLFFSKSDREAIAEGQKILDGLKVAAESSAKDTALAKVVSDEQERRDRTNKAALKAEREKLQKIADLNDKARAEIIEADIERTKEGTSERLALELQLLEITKAAAIRNVKEIQGITQAEIVKSVNLIEGLFGQQEDAARRKRRAPPKQTFGLDATPDVLTAVIEKQDAITKIERDAEIERLTTIRNLTLDGTQARLDAEAELQRAHLERIYLDAIDNKKQTNAELLALDKLTALEQRDIDAQTLRWKEQAKLQELGLFLDSAARTGAALQTIFGQNKAFAIAMTIINTSSAIMKMYADTGLNSYASIAAAIAVAAEGAAQIATIRRTNIGGGGGGSSSPSIASAPTSPASNPNANSGSSVNATQQQLTAIAGKNAATNGSIVVNIGTALGDRSAMQKTARELARMLRNDQGSLR